jgi:hypothetical protein
MVGRATQGIALIGLLAIFLLTPIVTESMGSLLDTVPIRIAATVIILASVAYDKFIALGIFMVISAIYIQHHQNDLDSITQSGSPISFKDLKSPKAMDNLEQGGHAGESHDEMDFTSKQEGQDNEFNKVDSSIDEKHTLQTEGLGSKSQSLFPDDSHHADSMMHGNRNGNHD